MSNFELQGYKFFPQLDSPGNDMLSSTNRNIQELKEQCDKNENCVAFNTAGYLKYKLTSPLVECKFFKTNDKGIYIKNKHLTNELANYKNNSHKIRIKMICNWCSCRQLCEEWKHMTKGNYTWNNLEITWEDNADFFVIINKPRGANEYFIPERTIVFHMEPWCGDAGQNWGVKTWGKWAEPDENVFLQVRSHKNFYNNAFWQLRTTYTEFKTQPIIKHPKKVISTICSSKYFDPGHIKRIDFIKYMDTHGAPIDIYNHDNKHKFKNYVGPHPRGYKDAGMLQYKYYFMAENNIEYNFITEKVWEPIIAECLCFYWGCPNVGDYIDPRAFIVLDLDDIPGSFKIVMDAINNDEWGKRLEIIRREKQKILDYFQFFPTIERVLEHDLRLNKNMTTDHIIYHKFFHQTVDQSIKNICFIYNNGNNNYVEKIKNHDVFKTLDYVYVINICSKKMEKVLHPKIGTINYIVEQTDSESIVLEQKALELIEKFAKYNPDSKILYINGNKPLSDYQTYFMLDHFFICTQLLTEFTAIGVDLKDNKFGNNNIFWTKSKFINDSSVEQISKVTIENWLDSDKAKHFSLCDIGLIDDLTIRGSYDNSDTVKRLNNYINNNKNYKTLCVNLLRRPDRKEEMIKLFEDNDITNYEFFEAVDGQKIVVTEEIRKIFEGNDFGSKRGYIGCALSHYNIWNNLINDKDHDYYFVCEDDIELADDFKFKLDMLTGTINNIVGWDIAHLGYSMYYAKLYQNYRKYRSNDVSNFIPFDPKTYIGGTFGYLISKNGAQKMVDFIKKNGIKHGIDYLAKKYCNDIGLIQYEASPHIIYSEWIQNGTDVDSDIQRDPTPLFTEKFKTVEEIYDQYIKNTITEKIHEDGVVCFLHSCTFNNNTAILRGIIDMLTSKEYDIFDRIYVTNFGNPVACSNEKVTIINWYNNGKQFEKPSLNLLHHFSKLNECKILYLHTKGVTHNGNMSQVIADWRNYMLYFLVEQGKDCIKILDKYDIVGVNYQEEPHKHYSGNFWWSNSKHIKLLEPIASTVRHDCEWWIMTKDNENYISLFNTGLDHYRTIYPREKYGTITLESYLTVEE